MRFAILGNAFHLAFDLAAFKNGVAKICCPGCRNGAVARAHPSVVEDVDRSAAVPTARASASTSATRARVHAQRAADGSRNAAMLGWLRWPHQQEFSGLAFYRGIPGTVGGALRMNAGAHGGERKNVLAEARAVDRSGKVHVFDNAGMGFTYCPIAASRTIIFSPTPFLKAAKVSPPKSNAR